MDNNVIIFIKNSKCKFLIHQRAWNKKTYPGKFGIGCGGKIDPGETPLEAAHRELKEELGIYGVELKFLFQKDNSHIYYLLWDGYYKKDCPEFKWIDWVDIYRVHKYDLCDDTRIFWKQYYESLPKD